MTKKIIFYFAIVSLISSCAVITAPTGGDRDQTPPKIVKETPPNKSIHFDSKSIDISMDEFIQVLSPQNIVISPSIEPPPEISFKKENITIKFKKSLDSNTTYSIFFGNSVGDMNENNILENYSYVFTTGDFLDSLEVHGKIQSTEGNIPDNTYLLMYKDQDDSAFQHKRPFYLSKVEKDGTVHVEHVKAGKYKIYALSDKNLNYYYDLPSEQIGFSDSAYTITGNFDSLHLSLFLPEESTLRIVEFDKAIIGGQFNFTLNKEISYSSDEITVSVTEDSSLQTAAFQDKDNKHIKVYFTNLPKDSNNYTLVVKNNNKIIDSIRVRCESRQFKTTAVYFTDTNALKNITVLETQVLKLRSNYYSLSPIDSSRIELRDSSQIIVPFSVSRDADLRTYLLNADWKDKMNYTLTFHDSAVYDLAGNYNKKQAITFKGISRKQAGTLVVNVRMPTTTHNTIIILKDNTGKVINTQVVRDSLSVRIEYGLLPAGNYSLETVDDINNNGIWNSGNFATKSLPEKIFKNPMPILIKENWDAEENIIVDYTVKSIVLPAPAPDSSKPNPSGLKLKTKEGNSGMMKK